MVELLVVRRRRVKDPNFLVLTAGHEAISVARKAAAEDFRVESHERSFALIGQVQVVHFALLVAQEGPAVLAVVEELKQRPLVVALLVDVFAEAGSTFDLVVQWTLLGKNNGKLAHTFSHTYEAPHLEFPHVGSFRDLWQLSIARLVV